MGGVEPESFKYKQNPKEGNVCRLLIALNDSGAE